jgi:hypothetical protein
MATIAISRATSDSDRLRVRVAALCSGTGIQKRFAFQKRSRRNVFTTLEGRIHLGMNRCVSYSRLRSLTKVMRESVSWLAVPHARFQKHAIAVELEALTLAFRKRTDIDTRAVL